jgi:hypothetical protein
MGQRIRFDVLETAGGSKNLDYAGRYGTFQNEHRVMGVFSARERPAP